ncbi:hypothetical protein LOM8899_00464 [Flavimaricola marinus]|uniref:Uncharacterized protein n=1 Tax=Flavimaricola marinus TaxID=1819565 RepID=A0A238L9R0_9RHOB|nr:hypothetical protein LOM8899_00464 [Flavimaricola marinus]
MILKANSEIQFHAGPGPAKRCSVDPPESDFCEGAPGNWRGRMSPTASLGRAFPGLERVLD